MSSSKRATRLRRRAHLAKRPLAVRAGAAEMTVRSIDAPLSIDQANRSVEVIAATESPVREYDCATDEMWPTVLLIAGARISDQQLPLLDDHDLTTIRSQIGSVRSPQRSNDPGLGPVLTYRAFVSSAEKDIWTKIEEGHLKRVSVGRLDGDLRPSQFAPPVFVQEGETREINGRSFSGPLRVITDWEPKEVSFTVLNADGRASVRSASAAHQPTPDKEVSPMNPKLKAMLVKRGLDANAGDAEARAFLRGVLATRGETLTTDEGAITSLEKEEHEKKEAEEKAKKDAAAAAAAAPAGAAPPAAGATATPAADPAAANRGHDVELILRTERERVLNIRAGCELNGVPSNIADDLIQRGASLSDANTRIRDWWAQQPGNQPVRTNVTVTRNEFDHVSSQIVEGLTLRAFGGNAERALGAGRTASNEARRWGGMRLVQIAERTLQAHGVVTDGLTDTEIAVRAIRMSPEGLGLATRAGDGAYVAPSTLPGFLLDVGNRVVLQGFLEANTRWRDWVRIGDPVNDFRPVAMYQGDEGGLLDMVPDDEEFQEDKTAQTKETTQAELYGKGLSFTYRAIVNDDLGFLTMRLSRRGRMADRTINRACLAILTGNPVLANDTYQVFDSTHHANIVTTGTGGAPSVTQLSLMRNLFRQQTGLNIAGIKMGLTLKNLIVPSALETIAEQVVYTRIDPGATNNEKYNPFGNKCSLIVEADLDETSILQYYGTCDYRDHDFVIIRFLRGQEAPLVGEFFNPKKMSRDYTVYQTWAGPTPVDYRGVVLNEGQ